MNQDLAKFVNTVQGHIKDSHHNRHKMKEDVTKIFDMMSKTKNYFTKTLLEGEEQGHCKGIKDRMDPNLKY